MVGLSHKTHWRSINYHCHCHSTSSQCGSSKPSPRHPSPSSSSVEVGCSLVSEAGTAAAAADPEGLAMSVTTA